MGKGDLAICHKKRPMGVDVGLSIGPLGKFYLNKIRAFWAVGK
jgi:hypothetical protein